MEDVKSYSEKLNISDGTEKELKSSANVKNLLKFWGKQLEGTVRNRTEKMRK